MNIFFDARWTTYPTHFGVSRYGTELVMALAKIHPVTIIVHDKRQLTMFPEGMNHVVLNNPMSWRELFIAPKLNKLGADVVFSPLQVMGSWRRRYKLILTMQDTIYYKYPTPPRNLPQFVRWLWKLSFKASWPQRLLLNLADTVVTVSHTSKKEIEQMHLTDRPVGVVYNAPDAHHGIARAKHIKKDLVFVGSFMAYKNHDLLVRMMNLLPEYTMHFTSPVWPERKLQLLEIAHNPRQITFWNGAPDKKMYQLLSSATAATSASRAEGFGLPIIEAMGMGTPVICTDMEIFHEVGGKAAQYCSPDSPEEFAAAVRKLEDPKVAAGYSKKGLEQAQKFSWDNSAKQLLRIIKDLRKTDA